MSFITILHDLHLANFASEKWDHDGIAELIEDFDLELELANDTHWLYRTLNSVLVGKPDLLCFDEVGTDVSNLLSYLSSDFGWTLDDYGEAIKIQFSSLNIVVMIHREGIDPKTRARCCISEVLLTIQST